MKKLIPALLLLVPVLLQSCLQGKYETTPMIAFHHPILVNKTDTIDLFYNLKEQKYSTDTMCVGDTITITVVFDAVGNHITLGEIEYDKQYAELEVEVAETDKLVDVITPEIADNIFRFTVADGYRAVRLPVNYIPVNAGTTQLRFRIESDSEYSPSEFVLLTPIKEKEETLSDDTEETPTEPEE